MQIEIRAYRKKAKMTQEDVAKLVGVKANTVSQWETGDRVPRVDMLQKLAGVFSCTVDDLLRHTAKVGGEG